MGDVRDDAETAGQSNPVISASEAPSQAREPGLVRSYLFLCGVPRSGTTALAKLLNRHEQVAIGIERYKGILAQGDRASLGPELFTPERFFDFRPADTNIRARSTYKALARKYSRCSVVGDKVPFLYTCANRVHRAFPEARIVFITREPIAVAASWQRRADNPSDRWPAKNGYKAAIAAWNEANRIAIELRAAYPDQFLIVRYDAVFGSDPAPIENVLRWAGLEQSEAFRSSFGEFIARSRPVGRGEIPDSLREHVSDHADMQTWSIVQHRAGKSHSLAIATR